MKRLVFLLIVAVLLAACGGNKEEEIPAPVQEMIGEALEEIPPQTPTSTPTPTCTTQVNILIGYDFDDVFTKVSSETITIELGYNSDYEVFYIPDKINNKIKDLEHELENRLDDFGLEFRVNYYYPNHYEECVDIQIEIWVEYDKFKDSKDGGYTQTVAQWISNETLYYSHEGITFDLTPKLLEQIIRGEEIPQRLPSATPVTPEEFSAAITKAAATYQISASHIGRATTLFNLASQHGKVEYITTMSDGYLWGALIPID